ncbi:MAG: cyclic nucleotide-binding domain-containing protein [Bacteroidota bacterium]
MKKVLFLLGVLEHQDIEWMLDEGELKTLNKGEVLIQQGQNITHLFLALSGSFRIVGTNEVEIAQVGSGEILGELSFIDSRVPSATVIAKESSEVLQIAKSVVKEKLEEDARFAARFYYSIASLLSHRLRKRENDSSNYDQDELDENIMDYIHKAGSSFSRILQEIRNRKFSFSVNT